jgi:isopenicillin N synthase-like dioxygenase
VFHILTSVWQLDNRKTPNFRGYSGLLSGNNDPNNSGDFQEGFEFGFEELSANDGNSKLGTDGVLSGPNVWPPEIPAFREAALQY